MKTKNAIIVAVSACLLTSCGGKKTTEELLAEKEAENVRLMQDMNLRNQYIAEVTDAINDVQDNLHSIAEKERRLRITKRDVESKTGNQQTQKEEILSDITDIRSMIENSRRTISDLEGRLSANKTRIASLETTVLKLTQNINEKEMEIADLHNELERLNILVSEKDKKLKTSERLLNTESDSLRQQKQHFNVQLEHSQKVYFAVGTEDQLLSLGILKKTGGNLFGGKTLVLNEHLSLEGLTSTIASSCNEIRFNFHSANIRLITPHDANSYLLESNRGIVITDKEEFWRLSKVAIVMVEE